MNSGYLKKFSHFIKLNDRKILVAVAESWKFVIVIVFVSVFAEMKLKVSILFLVLNNPGKSLFQQSYVVKSWDLSVTNLGFDE